jgi:hypothetical protein
MDQVCAELKRKKEEWKQRRKTFSAEEKKELRAYREGIDSRIQKVESGIVSDIYIWDTRCAPSNLFEMEMAMEIPPEQRLWLY